MKKENNEEKKSFLTRTSEFKTYEIILFSLLLIVVTAVLTLAVDNKILGHKTSSKKCASNSELEEVYAAYDVLVSEYYKEVDKDKLIQGAINGMLSSLDDPHTSYLNESETENFNDVMSGTYKGIGAELTINPNGEVYIVTVFKNSPAYEAGMALNDIITEVNGTSTKGLTTTEVVKLIRDEESDDVTIVVNRSGETKTFKMTKRYIEIESVESRIINKNDKNIGYIIINTFADNTYEQFRTQLEEMETKGIKGLVIDVRGNSGGYLHSVTNILDMFLPKGKVIYQLEDRTNNYKYTAKSNESRNYPVAVLMDKASASASEILSIALKESYDATLVGNTTYGKGTVQVTRKLSTGGMMKYTIQKWLSPNGNWINEVGVKPDYEINQSEEYYNSRTDEKDVQLQKALNIISKK